MIEVIPVVEPETPGTTPVTEALAIDQTSTAGMQPSATSNLCFSNAVQNRGLAAHNALSVQQSLNQVSVATLGKAVAAVQTAGPVEAKSAQVLLSSNPVAEKLAINNAITIQIPPDGILYVEAPFWCIYDTVEKKISFDILQD